MATSTPTQHGARAAAYLARLDDPRLVPPTPLEQSAAELHARLSKAAGTGAAYTQADEQLARAEANNLDSTALRKACVYAQLAD